MGRQVNSNIPEDGYKSKKDFEDRGRIADADFTIYSAADPTKTIAFDATKSSAFTPTSQQTWTITGAGTVTNLLVNSQIVGNSLVATGKFTGGTSTAVAFSINLPSAYTIATTLLPEASFLAGSIFVAHDSEAIPSATTGSFPIFFDGTLGDKVFVAITAASGDLAKVNGDDLLDTGDNCYFQINIPVTGF